LRRWDDIQRLVDTAYGAFDRIDIWVNNAGMFPLAPSSTDTTEALFVKVVDVNFKGPFRNCDVGIR
jgi:NAD(P)-dependent dehydrogenase (short-subunit alcohol dehydrogenase family)